MFLTLYFSNNNANIFETRRVTRNTSPVEIAIRRLFRQEVDGQLEIKKTKREIERQKEGKRERERKRERGEEGEREEEKELIIRFDRINIKLVRN